MCSDIMPALYELQHLCFYKYIYFLGYTRDLHPYILSLMQNNNLLIWKIRTNISENLSVHGTADLKKKWNQHKGDLNTYVNGDVATILPV